MEVQPRVALRAWRMKLADYLHQRRITPAQFRQHLGLHSRSSVNRYLTGQRRPDYPVLQRIIELTEGRVQLADFLDPSPPKCGTIVTLPDGRRKLVFPWSTRDAELDACLASLEEEHDEPPRPTTPVLEAIDTLGARARVVRDGEFLLDGRPADARRLIIAANRLRVASHRPPIVYPGLSPKDWA